jgi:hypothetical protein
MDVISCLDATTGIPFWQHSYPAKGNLDYGNSMRATPCIHDAFVVTLGAFGDLVCLDLETGQVRWSKHLIRDLQGELPQWGYSGSPIVVENKLIVQPGGAQTSIVALELASGETVWQSAGRPAAYASLVEWRTEDRHGVIGFDYRSLGAWDLQDGTRLWELKPEVANDFNVPTPVLTPNGVVLTSENNATRAFDFDAQGALAPSPTAVYHDLAGDSHSPIRLGRYLVGVDRGLHVLDLENGLQGVSTLSKTALDGYCSLIGFQDRVLVTCENGEVLLLRIGKQGVDELGRLQVADPQAQILAYPAVAGKTFFVRLPDGVQAWSL